MTEPDLSIGGLFNVKGKVALVTGGGTGLGQMMASALVSNGAKVYIASRKEHRLKEAAARMNENGPGSCSVIVADISSQPGCVKLISTIVSLESKLHILINNAGASWPGFFHDIPEKGWDRVYAVNVKAVFYLSSGLSNLLSREATINDPGRIINISSLAAVTPNADSSPFADPKLGLWTYHTTKAAQDHLTSQLASTLAEKHITVNAILPGLFRTQMTEFGFQKYGEAQMVSGIPMGRMGKPQDIAGVALFLASPASAHVTGAHIILDGGAAFGRPSNAKWESKL